MAQNWRAFSHNALAVLVMMLLVMHFEVSNSQNADSDSINHPDLVAEEPEIEDIILPDVPDYDVEPAILDGVILYAGPESIHDRLGSSDPDLDKFFLAYLTDHGVKELHPPLNKLYVDRQPEFANEKGLLVSTFVRPGEILISIPYSAALVLEADDPEPFEGAGGTFALAAKLLREVSKGPDSPYWPYLRTFPAWIPIPWWVLEPEEFSEAQIRPTVKRLTHTLQYYSQAYANCLPYTIANASWREFAWAVSMVHSRAYYLDVPVSEGALETKALKMFLPVADLLNHSPKQNVEWSDKGIHHDRLEILAMQHMLQGDTATADYGPHSSEYFLLMYGFVPSENPHDFTIIFQDLEEAVRWYLRRYHPTLSTRGSKAGSKRLSASEVERFLDIAKAGARKHLADVGRPQEAANLAAPTSISIFDNSHGGAFVVFPDGKVDARLLGALAGVQLELDGFLKVATQQDWENTYEEVYIAIRRRCAEMLMTYPTTVKQDKSLIRHARETSGVDCQGADGEDCQWVGMNPAVQLLVQFRLAQKLTLEAFMDFHSSRRRHGADMEEL